jgi:hypothetical protein
MSLQFGFVILRQKAFGAKAALKTLVKLTPGGTLVSKECLNLFNYLFQQDRDAGREAEQERGGKNARINAA